MPLHAFPVSAGITLYKGDIESDMLKIGRNGLADQITGGLSLTTKMPCPSWSLSAFRCQIASVLAKKPGTTCTRCYALKGHYGFPNVRKRLERRYQGLFHELWTPAMAFLINWHCDRYFR